MEARGLRFRRYEGGYGSRQAQGWCLTSRSLAGKNAWVTGTQAERGSPEASVGPGTELTPQKPHPNGVAEG